MMHAREPNEKPILVIVDDNRDTVGFLRKLIEAASGWQVIAASNAVDAKSLIAEHHPDAALIDFDLGPGPNGIEIGDWFKENNPGGVVIIMSGLSARSGEWVDQAVERGFQTLQKPFMASDVMARVIPVVARAVKPAGAIEAFVSYSHRDERLRQELEKHLSILRRKGLIDSWCDRRIVPGEEFAPELMMRLERADLILLLISSDFLASDFCYGREMEQALHRHENGEARVIPVIVRPVDWHESPFGKLLALPTDGRPVTTWPTRDQAFLDIARGIKRAVESLANARGEYRAPGAVDE